MSSVRWLERYLAKRKRARERAYYQRMTPTQRAARFANNARYKRETRARLLALSPVTCPACAVVFVRRRSNQVYCSRACKDRRPRCSADAIVRCSLARGTAHSSKGPYPRRPAAGHTQ